MRNPLTALRTLLRREQSVPEQPTQRPDRSRIAVLENELLGIKPEPGTPEAMAVAQSIPVDRTKCPHDDVIDVSRFESLRPEGMCERCGAAMVADDDGDWSPV